MPTALALRIKPLVLALSVSALLTTQITQAFAQRNPSENLSTTLSKSMGLSVLGASAIVGGSLATVVGTGKFVVAGLQVVGEIAGQIVYNVVLASAEAVEGIGKTIGNITIRIAAPVVGAARLALGTGVTIIKEAAGWALNVDGKLMAFVVNDEGEKLLKQKKIASRDAATM
jgi:hypothetical protein